MKKHMSKQSSCTERRSIRIDASRKKSSTNSAMKIDIQMVEMEDAKALKQDLDEYAKD